MSDQNQWNQGSQPSANDPYGQVPADPYAQFPADDADATRARSSLTNPPPAPLPPANVPQGPIHDPNQWGQQQAYDPYAGVGQQPITDPYGAPAQAPVADPYAGYNQGQQQQYAYAPGQPSNFNPNQAGSQGSNFFQDLFDLSFKRPVAHRLAPIIYILVIIATAVMVVGSIISSFAMGSLVRDGGLQGVISIFVFSFYGLVSIGVARIVLDGIVSIIRISEDTKELKEKSSS